MTDADLIAKLKVPPNCEWFRLFGNDKKSIAFGRPDLDPGCLDSLSILDSLERVEAACVALQYWWMEQRSCLAVQQIDAWAKFGGFDK